MRKNYTRVTDALYPFSGLQKVDPFMLKNAAERGTKVHEACSAIINDMGVIDLDQKLFGYIKSFQMWRDKEHREIMMAERWYCDKYMLTGECDFLYKE